MNEIWQRFSMMIGEKKMNKLNEKRIILFGVGGVGGYVAEMLVRSGICDLTIVDFDKVDVTNINRQIVALHSTVGKYKVDVMEERLLDINQNANIVTIKEKLSAENINNFNLVDYDYIVDCIDDVKAKQALIKYCSQNELNIIVSCGAGNRYKNNPQFLVSDISKTNYDRLAKVIRKFCQTEDIQKLNVVWTKEQPQKASKVIGSVAYFPASMACTLSSFVINQLLNNMEEEE